MAIFNLPYTGDETSEYLAKARDFSGVPLDDGIYTGSKTYTAYDQYLNDRGALFKLNPAVALGYTINVSLYPEARLDPSLIPYTSFESASTEAIEQFELDGADAIVVFNADGASAIATFNADGVTAIADFNSSGNSAIDDFNVAGQLAIDNLIYSVGFVPVGVWGIGETVDNLQQGLWYNNELYTVTNAVTFPVTVDGVNPIDDTLDWANQTLEDRKTVARGLNVKDVEVIYHDDTATVLDNVLYIYDKSANQKTWVIPALNGLGETITSVVGEILNTTGGSYTLIDPSSSAAYIFDTYALMKDSTIVFPVDKILRTKRFKTGFSGGGASYVVTAGSSPDPIGSPDLNAGGYALLKIKDGEVRPEPYGAVGDVGDGVIDTPALQAAYLSSVGRKLKLIAGKEYFINTSQAFKPASDTTVELNDAKLTVPVGAIIVDPVGDGGVVYENGLWHLPVGQVANNFKIRNGKLEVKTEKIGLFTAGSATATIGDVRRKNIGIKKIVATATLLTSTFLFWANACDLKVIENEVADIGFMCTGSENSGLLKNNQGEFIGVTRDFVTWNNASALRMNGARGMDVGHNKFKYTGGTAVTVRAAASYSHINLIHHNELTGIGLTAISASNTAGGGSVKKVQITNNIVNGYLCAPGGASHGGIDVSGAAGAPAVTEDLLIAGNIIDYLCFDPDGLQEVFNPATAWSEGGVNALKQIGSTGVGSSSAISVSYQETNSAGTFIISDNIIKNYQNQSLRVEFCKFPSVHHNSVANGGWERTAANAPIVANWSIGVVNCLGPKVESNTAVDACLGNINTSGSTTPFVMSGCSGFSFANNTYITNDGSHNQHAFAIIGGSIATDSFDLFGYTAANYVGYVGTNVLFAPGLNKYNILSGSSVAGGGGDLEYTFFDSDLNSGVALFIPPTLGMYERFQGLQLATNDVKAGGLWIDNGASGVIKAGTL